MDEFRNTLDTNFGFRLYLINSPAVRGENLRFREEGVKDILKDVFLPWYNAYRFLVQNVQRYESEEKVKFRATLVHSTNIMDRWIMSFTHSLVAYVHKEMAGEIMLRKISFRNAFLF